MSGSETPRSGPGNNFLAYDLKVDIGIYNEAKHRCRSGATWTTWTKPAGPSSSAFTSGRAAGQAGVKRPCFWRPGLGGTSGIWRQQAILNARYRVVSSAYRNRLIRGTRPHRCWPTSPLGSHLSGSRDQYLPLTLGMHPTEVPIARARGEFWTARRKWSKWPVRIWRSESSFYVSEWLLAFNFITSGIEMQWGDSAPGPAGLQAKKSRSPLASAPPRRSSAASR